MNNILTTKNLAIHFKSLIPNETYYIYDVELENISNNGVNYDMKNLYCSNGENVLNTNIFDLSLIEGKILLNDGHIIVNGEKVIGVVAFEKDVTITNDSPLFEYDEWEVTTSSAQIGGL